MTYIYECMYCTNCATVQQRHILYDVTMIAHKLFFVLMKMEYFSISDIIGLMFWSSCVFVCIYILNPSVECSSKEMRKKDHPKNIHEIVCPPLRCLYNFLALLNRIVTSPSSCILFRQYHIQKKKKQQETFSNTEPHPS